jgi:hypothetical protein
MVMKLEWPTEIPEFFGCRAVNAGTVQDHFPELARKTADLFGIDRPGTHPYGPNNTT